jgi:hypothetical protein
MQVTAYGPTSLGPASSSSGLPRGDCLPWRRDRLLLPLHCSFLAASGTCVSCSAAIPLRKLRRRDPRREEKQFTTSRSAPRDYDLPAPYCGSCNLPMSLWLDVCTHTTTSRHCVTTSGVLSPTTSHLAKVGWHICTVGVKVLRPFRYIREYLPDIAGGLGTGGSILSPRSILQDPRLSSVSAFYLMSTPADHSAPEEWNTGRYIKITPDPTPENRQRRRALTSDRELR